MKIEKPNLFIVGAAKSATTSLYRYLSQHPAIFFCNLKEPGYFSSKYKNFPHNGPGDYIADNVTIKEESKYIDLFKSVKNEKIIGEASVDYLYYYNTAYDINKFSSNAKIIIILRNPVDRAFSTYVHLRGAGRENLTFEEALQQEKSRMNNNYEFIWFYKDVGKYYQQVKTYLEVFGEENVLIILFDELKKDIKSVMKKIMFFLNINPNVSIDDQIKYNFSGIPKYKIIDLILKNRELQHLAKKVFPARIVRRIGYKMLEKNLKKPILAKKTRFELIKYFTDDIIMLQNLIGRNLSMWLNRRE